MAATAFKIIKDGLAIRSMIMTTPQSEGYLITQMYHCDENFKPVGKPITGVDPNTEEEYHKVLRLATKKAGTFVPEHSTDPEWNPE